MNAENTNRTLMTNHTTNRASAKKNILQAVCVAASRGTMALLFLLTLMLAAVPLALAQTETVLYSFCSQPGCTDGKTPQAGLTLDTKGNLYGTTTGGGANDRGTVFKLTSTGTETVLYSFCSQPGCTDGANPYYSGVVRDKAGNLYGTTDVGGANGLGTVFKLTPSGTETVLYSFGDNGTDGTNPQTGVVLDKAGNLYGTTFQGGANGYGTVFKVTPSGTETILHSFDGTDGYNVYAGVVLGKKNTLYGTTGSGGTHDDGTVYKLTPSGTLTTLYSFDYNGTDGFNPLASVAFDKAGNIYGTTYEGGANGVGTVFKLTPSLVETILHSFGSGTDGFYPYFGEGVILDKLGNLYGATNYGGTADAGAVYEITSSGTETVLYSFSRDGGDGIRPYGGLVLGKKGSLYGTTQGGGANSYGTVYKVVP